MFDGIKGTFCAQTLRGYLLISIATMDAVSCKAKQNIIFWNNNRFHKTGPLFFINKALMIAQGSYFIGCHVSPSVEWSGSPRESPRPMSLSLHENIVSSSGHWRFLLWFSGMIRHRGRRVASQVNSILPFLAMSRVLTSAHI